MTDLAIFAALDARGLPTGFYRSDVHDAIPPNLQAITEAQWLDCLANPGARAWDKATSTFVPYAPPAPPVDLVAYAAAARYARETAGVTVGGEVIATDRGSQTMIANAFALSQLNPTGSFDFKASTGWVTLTADQIKATAQAVGAHVQACFSKEREVDTEIVVGAITTAAQVDAAFASIS